MFSQNLAKFSKKRHVLILLDVLQMEATLQPPTHIHSTTFAGKTCSAEQETMFLQNLAKFSKKRHVLILLDVLQMGGTAPFPTSRSFWQLLSKQIARLSKK